MINREELKMEMLSKVNKEAIEAYISATDGAATYDVDLTHILNQWAENKVHIYEMLGRNLKVSEEVICNIPEGARRKMIDKFINDNQVPQYLLANNFITSIRIDEASNNYLERDYWLLGTRFAKGMRVSRCLKQLMDNKLVSDYQTRFSMFIQKFKVNGKAVISIDPMDYLTMSVNSSGWRSCHIITNGIHKAGCISYMIDKSTAISYTTDKVMTANRKYEGLSYDNKLWRQCVHIGDTFALQARQYPADYPSNRKTVADMLVKLFNAKMDTDTFSEEEKSRDAIYGLQFNISGNAYNDIYCGSLSNGGGLIMSDELSDLEVKISINAPALCCHCGGDHKVRNSESLVCSSCYNDLDYYNCDDDDYDDDDDYYEED